VTVQGAGAGGTYTIDNTQPTAGTNFASFTAAITFLNSSGQCGAFTGPHIFNVAAGQIFNELPPSITAIGTATNPITFQKSGAGVNPKIVATGTTGTSDQVLGTQNGADYLTFDGIDIGVTGTAVEFGFLFRNASGGVNGASNNTIKNSTITLDRTNISSIGIYIDGAFNFPNSQAGTNNDNLIEFVTVQNSSRGIFINSNSSTYPGLNNKVLNSTVGAATAADIGVGTTAAYGIYFNLQMDGVISGNLVQNIAATAFNRGIWYAGARGVSVISNNKINGVRNSGTASTSGQRGIEVGGSTVGTGVDLRVFNNFVSNITSAYTGVASATRVLQGILVSTAGANLTYNIDHNNVSIDGSGSLNVSSVALEFAATTSVNKARNNVLANFTADQTAGGVAKHYVIRSGLATGLGAAGSVSNYNDLFLAFSVNGFIGLASTTDHATKESWTTATGQDAQSITVDPLFVNNTT
ncbi:MAG: hypothetical protein M3R08_11490, partial [Bacteroidota bacterium]|nr:hypothetical protein [Bacteroidota bacterium]